MTDYGIQFAPTLDRPHETMVGETVFDAEGNAIGWIVNATVDVGTCKFNVVIDNDPSPRHRGNICECNKCGYRCARGFIVDERFKCCPNCGRRIMKD